MASYIVFFLLFLLSFIVLPFGVTEFETPKVMLGEAGIILLFLVLLFQNQLHFEIKRFPLVLFAGLVLLSCINLIFFNTGLSFFGNAFRMQGIFLLWLLIAFAILTSHISFKKIHWSIFAGILIVQVILLFYFGQNESLRFIGSLGEPNTFAANILFLWPFVFFAVKKFDRKEIICIAVVLLLVGVSLFLSGSKSAVIGFGIQLLFIFLSKIHVSKIKIFAVCLFIYVISYALPFISQTVYENRAEIWHAAFVAGSMNPLFGNGFGNSEIVLHNTAHHLSLPVQYYYVDSAHNIFLDYFVQGGVIGFLIIFLLVSIAMKKFAREDNMQNIVLLFGTLTVLSFNPASIVNLLALWWLIGQGLNKNT